MTSEGRPVDTPPVRVAIRAGGSVSTAWSALTEPARLGMWLGDMDAAWEVGRTGRIDFGDSDFFVVTAREIVERQRVRFEWSFLGVGVAQEIEWRVSAVPGGVEVVVEDRDPHRGPSEVEQMREGWTDFLHRLGRHLETGERTRYRWRGEIDGSTELPAGAAPLDPDLVYRWLPVAGDGTQPRWFFVVDADGPRRFAIEDWRPCDTASLTFAVAIPGAATATRCEVVVEPPGGGRLRFSHTGWRELGLSDRTSRELRARFAAAWTAALASAGDPDSYRGAG